MARTAKAESTRPASDRVARKAKARRGRDAADAIAASLEEALVDG